MLFDTVANQADPVEKSSADSLISPLVDFLFPRSDPLKRCPCRDVGMLQAVADKEGVLLSSRQTDRQVVGATQNSRAQTCAQYELHRRCLSCRLKLGSCKLDFYEMILKE